MIYDSEARAIDVANLLNGRRGVPHSWAILTKDGWAVITALTREEAERFATALDAEAQA